MFCENLKHYRKLCGMSQKSLSAALGVSQQAVAKWELGTASPTPDMIVRISQVLHVTIDNLLQGNCTIGERLAQLRRQAGYKSQQELAAALGINQTAVSQWERGATLPSTTMLLELSKLYDVSTDYLLCCEPTAETIISKLDGLSVAELAEVIFKAAELIKEKQQLVSN